MKMNKNKQTQDLTLSFDLDENSKPLKQIIKRQKATFTICIIILILILLIGPLCIWLNTTTIRTEQIGLVALLDAAYAPDNIPDKDPIAVPIPENDDVIMLNEKLDKDKMCINMVSYISLKNTYSSGYFNIVNDEANNYPQFVTITLNTNDAIIYQSGLIEPGKCIPYDTLDIVLPAGTYNCTATFAQVDTETNSICGKAAAEVVININT